MSRTARTLKHIHGHLEALAASVGEPKEPRSPPVHRQWQQEVLILPSAAGGTRELEEFCSTMWLFSAWEAAGGMCVPHLSRDSGNHQTTELAWAGHPRSMRQ